MQTKYIEIVYMLIKIYFKCINFFVFTHEIFKAGLPIMTMRSKKVVNDERACGQEGEERLRVM